MEQKNPTALVTQPNHQPPGDAGGSSGLLLNMDNMSLQVPVVLRYLQEMKSDLSSQIAGVEQRLLTQLNEQSGSAGAPATGGQQGSAPISASAAAATALPPTTGTSARALPPTTEALEASKSMERSTTEAWKPAGTLETFRNMADREVEKTEGRRLCSAVIFASLAGMAIWGSCLVFGVYALDTDHEGETWRMSYYGNRTELWTAMNVSKWPTTGTSFGSNLETFKDFQRMDAVLTWITVLLTGFGSEALLGVFMQIYVPLEVLEFGWTFSQFLFPLFVLISVQAAAAGEAYCYIFLVFGMWKFGFPETLVFLTNLMEFQRSRGKKRYGVLKWVTNFCNGIGTVMHHSASAMVVVMLHKKFLVLNQPLACVIMPLVMQHWFCLLKYKSVALYAIIEFTLEFFWEWEMFSNLQHFTGMSPFSWTTCLAMLVAHWLYWIGAILSFLVGALDPDQQDIVPMVEDEIPWSFQRKVAEQFLWFGSVLRRPEARRHLNQAIANQWYLDRPSEVVYAIGDSTKLVMQKVRALGSYQPVNPESQGPDRKSVV